MVTKTQTNNVEQAVEPVKETEAAVGQDSVTAEGAPAGIIVPTTVPEDDPASILNDTEYLLQSEANANRLKESVDQIKSIVGDYVKPTFEFVRVDAFLPVEVVVGQPAYIRVLGEFDTKEMVSTVPVFTQPVTVITDNGFETDDAIYVEVK